MTPEEQKIEKERVAKIMEERKKKHQKLNAPMSENQEKDVWEKDDKMAPEEFSLEKYFKLHDIDGSGSWDKQEVSD